MTKNHRVAVIPGDGIGNEVVPAALTVLDAACEKFSINLEFDHFDFASCKYYQDHGQMMPDDWKDRIGGHDAIFFGAVGWPDLVPDHISLWGSLIKFRREFDQYVNLRPVKLMPGVPHHWQTVPRAISIFSSSVKIPKANILPSAARCSPILIVNLSFRKAYLPATALIASSNAL